MNELQTRLDRMEFRPEFNIDWERARELPAMRLIDLCALSVGMHPSYAELVQGMTRLDQHEPINADELIQISEYRNERMEEFRRRVHVTTSCILAGELKVLHSAEGLNTPVDRIIVNSADFAALASAKSWALPMPLKQRDASDKPLNTRERNTLLTIIAALCKEAKIDYTKHAKAAGLIEGVAAEMGVSISETAIENHLKKIPGALESRIK